MNEWLCFLSCGDVWQFSQQVRAAHRPHRGQPRRRLPVSLRDAIPGLDHLNLRLVTAIRPAAGQRL
jgi:hypothetical protein